MSDLQSIVVETNPLLPSSSTSTVVYNSTLTTCSICQDMIQEGQIYQTPCYHIYHNTCWNKMIKNQRKNKKELVTVSCPNCRQPVPIPQASKKSPVVRYVCGSPCLTYWLRSLCILVCIVCASLYWVIKFIEIGRS
jgi:Ring finger domain